MKRGSCIILILFFCTFCNGQSKDLKNYNFKLDDILTNHVIDTSRISLIIDKSDYKLTVLYDSIIIKEYPVVFGRNSTDDKLRQGDKCTPEGRFLVLKKYPHPRWSKFIWINYPTVDSWEKHNRAINRGEIPKDSKIGGEIGIHGVPKGMDYLIEFHFNWTAGCISMKNNDINEIFPYIWENTVIIIK